MKLNRLSTLRSTPPVRRLVKRDKELLS